METYKEQIYYLKHSSWSVSLQKYFSCNVVFYQTRKVPYLEQIQGPTTIRFVSEACGNLYGLLPLIRRDLHGSVTCEATK